MNIYLPKKVYFNEAKGTTTLVFEERYVAKTIDEKTEILYTFANEFNVVAKIAFENEPELLNTILIKRK